MVLREKDLQSIRAYMREVFTKREVFYESLRKRDLKALATHLKELPPAALRPARVLDQYSPRVIAAVQKARERVVRNDRGKVVVGFIEGNVKRIREKYNGRGNRA